jgi:hypothetical protein
MRLFLSTIVLILLTDLAIAACGSRGGPAFRGPNGKCVGWKALDKVCGTPPTTHCTYEGGGLGDTGQEKGSAFIAGMTGGPTRLMGSATLPSRSFNVRVAKHDGIACTSQTMVAEIASCLVASGAQNDCKAKVDQALAGQACLRIQAGTEATIEAGSHSFDWIRFRVGGHPQALWARRELLLQ